MTRQPMTRQNGSKAAGSAPATDAAVPADDAAAPAGALLQVTDLVQEFTVKGSKPFQRGRVSAVAGVSFGIARGETLALVGETGSGKSTIARALLASPPALSGSITLGGRALPVGQRAKHERGPGGAGVQMVFQDPYGALDPRWSAARSVTEPLITAGVADRAERRRRVAEIMHLVGLDASRFAGRLPRELSGGQAQRVAIARAVALEPSLLICDEAVSSLDVLIQAQVLNLFERLRRELGLSYLFIAHDLALVKQVSDRVAVMYLGKFCEVGPGESVYKQPLHPYTKALLDSIPSTEPGAARAAATLHGEPPSPINPPSGCRFRTRCPRAVEKCAAEVPEPRELGPGHLVACHFPLTEEPPAGSAGSVPSQTAARTVPSTAEVQG